MNFLHILRRFVFIFLAVICWISLGSDSISSHYQESGLPHIQVCLPGTFTYVNHFNSIVQGSDDFIYIGARSGILRYNSQTWNYIPANGDIRLVRHLDNIIAYSKDQLYIIPPTHKNTFEFPDSLFPPGVKRPSGNILQVLSHNENLYILTSAGLFLQRSDTLSEISTPSRVIRIFPSGEGAVLGTEDNKYYSHDGEQIHVLELPGELDLLSDIIPNPDKILYINEPGNELILERGKEIPLKLEDPGRFLNEFSYRSAAWLNNGMLALGSTKGGVILVDQEGMVKSRINIQDGLYSNKVIQLLADEANNLWVLHDYAVSRIEIPSPFSYYRDENGLKGNTKDILRYDGIIYAATSHGLFRLHPAKYPLHPADPNSVFQKVEGLNTDCRCLESTPNGILAGTNMGLFEVSNENTRLVFPGAVNCLLYISDQNILLAGTEAGLRIFNSVDWSEIRNFALPNISIDNIELSPGNILWLSSRSGTLFRSSKPFSNPGNLLCESFTSDQLKVPRGTFISLIKTSEKLYFSTLNGLLEFNPVSGAFYPDTTIIFPNNKTSYRVSSMAEDGDKNLWIDLEYPGSKSSITRLARYSPSVSPELQSLSNRRLNERIINCFYPEPEETLWIGTDEGIFHYDPSQETTAESVSHTYITKVFSGESGDMEKVPVVLLTENDNPGRVIIPHAKNSLRFEFLSTDFNRESDPLYQYMMTGMNEDWSPWNDNDFVEFNGLKKGRYDFQVRSQDIYGFTSEADLFQFRIKAPVFAAWYAIMCYVLLLITLIWWLQKWTNLQKIKGQFHLEEVVQERTESLIKEKDKADDLLANILPKSTADELKAGGKATSSKFKMCSVLFADIQGFTKIAEEMNPDKLIDQLDKFYYQFDSVVEKYNIEKIKTIGDAYMAAGGIPIKNRTNPVDVVLAALEMQQYMKKLKETQSDIWDLRIGIHTGSVIAGVVGQKKYSYDIWGDTVNTASRMESSGEIGKVNISATTYKLIKDFFQCEFRGKMPVKYKGDIAMFFVNGLNPTFSEADKITPNEKFNVQIQLLRLLDLEEVVLEKLTRELPEDLFFHNVEHTSHVYTQVELLGRGEKVSEEDLLLLQTAALLHDTGYIQGMEEHEVRSVDFAREILPVYRYNEEQIEKICSLIQATSLPPNPENLLEQIICDANLDHLGRVDFLIQSDKLFQEYRVKHKIRSKKDWNQYQIDFLKSHEFFTPIANRMREVPKDQQIENIRQFS